MNPRGRLTHAIDHREHARILAALRSTTMSITDIARANGREAITIRRIAEANGVSLAGRRA